MPLSSETSRIRSVKRFLTLDLNIDEDLQDILTLAATVCRTPVALITLLDGDTQWMSVRRGTDIESMPQEISFCNTAIRQDNVLVVPDLTQDERFIQNPLVTGEMAMRFYAGAPLRDGSGHRLGTLCVVDRTPHYLTTDQIATLRIFSKQAMRLMELKLSMRLLQKRNERIERQQQRILAQNATLREVADYQSHQVRGPVASILGVMDLVRQDTGQFVDTYLPLLEQAVGALDKSIYQTVGKAGDQAAEPEAI